MTILDQLAGHAKERVREAKKKFPLEEIRQMAFDRQAAFNRQIAISRQTEADVQSVLSILPEKFAFENALKKPGVAFICECKKASPSKGLIAPDFPYVKIAREYEAAGADCISVLTEPKWFLGSDDYLKGIAAAVKTPCLRKDFTVDEYMIYEAKLLGASAVLLICAILETEQMKEYIHICDELGLSALVEAHDEKEVEMALNAKARIIGVNNRNLKDFTVDTENSRRLREQIPDGVLFVSESGVRDAKDVENLVRIGADAVLVGETLMRAADKKAKLSELRGG